MCKLSKIEIETIHLAVISGFASRGKDIGQLKSHLEYVKSLGKNGSFWQVSEELTRHFLQDFKYNMELKQVTIHAALNRLYKKLLAN